MIFLFSFKVIIILFIIFIFQKLFNFLLENEMQLFILLLLFIVILLFIILMAVI